MFNELESAPCISAEIPFTPPALGLNDELENVVAANKSLEAVKAYRHQFISSFLHGTHGQLSDCTGLGWDKGLILCYALCISF